LFLKLDANGDGKISQQDFADRENGAWLWKKLLWSVGNNPIDPTIKIITRPFLHNAVLMRALNEMGSDGYTIQQQPMPGRMYDYLTSVISLSHFSAVLFLAYRVEYWLTCLEDELVVVPVRQPAMSRRALSKAVLAQGKNRKHDEADVAEQDARGAGELGENIMLQPLVRTREDTEQRRGKRPRSDAGVKERVGGSQHCIVC
jgi:hypothetical protein